MILVAVPKVETLSCKVHKLHCTCKFPISLLSIVLVAVVGHVFCVSENVGSEQG